MEFRISELLGRLGVEYVPDLHRIDLFTSACTHKSWVEEQLGTNNNIQNLHYDRLEFLGDAILKAVINEHIYGRFVEYNSGQLSKLSAYLLSDKVLSQIALDKGLQPFMRYTRKVNSSSILGDVLESIFGAMYLCCGYDCTRQLILSLYHDKITEANANELKDNYKAALQEYTQSKQLGLPEYRLQEQGGPPHDPVFTVVVLVQGQVLGSGHGKSKKVAEQNAAQQALIRIEAQQS